ncbi:MAG: DUF488 domain-containing protein [Cyanobacteria bacterium]|nr:DUF488 domain-containing protein [Cyanobacteriota bacterium]MDW8202422.1 DUF488 domain-containing protein [Cyanobacteriota bacterium SKYGB_h_bin112]
MSQAIHLFTIGFTQKSAQVFFESLIQAGVKRVIDTRLNNVSQLAGFTKRSDLDYFLRKIAGIEYVHYPDFAPTKPMLDAYKKQRGDWANYEQQFLQLMTDRQIETLVSPEFLNGACLLCSEAEPHHCHRRLVAEYLNQHLGHIAIHHL